ncbi:hypothetical protein [Ruminococcus sp.]|jgi:hypothetical protein|uniref:hypothetical protein n=1 Tax=Ruminococcus sp. TaxID=41978 RepID=UPI0025FDAC90|nr:hypothetical protein [Ruminococcus sp.]
MEKIVKLGDVKLVEVSDKNYLAYAEIDETHYETNTQDIIEGLGFIQKTLTEHCSDREIELKGKSKRISYRLSMDINEYGYYKIIATARKSVFSLCVKNKDDVVKVLEAMDLAFPRRPLREFIGETAREALKWVTKDSFND